MRQRLSCCQRRVCSSCLIVSLSMHVCQCEPAGATTRILFTGRPGRLRAANTTFRFVSCVPSCLIKVISDAARFLLILAPLDVMDDMSAPTDKMCDFGVNDFPAIAI